MSTDADRERFRGGAQDYAAYLATPEGRLRSDLAFANVREFLRLPQPPRSLRALDIGCGTGAIGVRLARLGVHVTLLDSSPTMLDLANRAAREAGVAEKVVLKHGDAAQVANLLGVGSFDLILCHNLLEFVEDPDAVLRAAEQVMGDSSAILSVLVRNRAGEVFKAAIQTGDLAGAEHTLTAEWGRESLFGSSVRLFTPDSLQAMLKAASLAVAVGRGVRVISDYLPPTVSRNAEYEKILDLERKLGRRAEFAAVARYTHYLTCRAAPVKAVRA
jgi:2-polyprenyl-3-methyl-5-hydroxy-6-metoxy-1,4-benzoquinol methylase